MKDKGPNTVGLAKSVLTGIYCSINSTIQRNGPALGMVSKIQGSLGTRQKSPLEDENLNYSLDGAGPIEHGSSRPEEHNSPRKLPCTQLVCMTKRGA